MVGWNPPVSYCMHIEIFMCKGNNGLACMLCGAGSMHLLCSCMLEVPQIWQNNSWMHHGTMCNDFVKCVHLMTDVRWTCTFCIWRIGAWTAWYSGGVGATQFSLPPLVTGDQFTKAGV